jgi:hypothetical protein
MNCYTESKNWMGAACSIHGIEVKCTLSFNVESGRELIVWKTYTY